MKGDEDGKLLVRCVENPTADPRVFYSIDDKRGCAERIAREGKCTHMIKIRGGSDKNFFKKRLVRYTKVVRSINGWAPITVSNQFGGTNEAIGATTSELFQDIVDNDDDNSTEMEAMSSTEAAQIDLSSTRVRPLSKKGASDVVPHATFHCDGCLDDTKFVVAAILIKIKQLVTGGANNADSAMLGESQDLVEATRGIVAQC